jgi:hypothetical protein
MMSELLIANAFLSQSDPLIPSHLGPLVGGPEKAGGGGSILSLATTISLKIKPYVPRSQERSADPGIRVQLLMAVE